jgi:hypothetical protein
MQTKYEVNNFSRVTLHSKVEFSLSSMVWIWPNLLHSNGTKGTSQKVSSIWKVKDHGSHDMTWKPNKFFNFEHQTRCTRAIVVQLLYTDDV